MDCSATGQSIGGEVGMGICVGDIGGVWWLKIRGSNSCVRVVFILCQ